MFDTYGMVDWSAASVPRTGRDSIWICWHAPDGERLENPATRHAAKALLDDLLTAAVGRGERVLVGFDFPFGYPAGFAAGLGLSEPPWRAVWDEIARLLEDAPDNANNRFHVAATLNRRAWSGPFPFWGCPAASAGPFLGPRHHRGHEQNGLAERRLIDEYMPGAQPCWKLLGTGSVGGQMLTGIPVVRALRDDPRWRERVQIWPFETGLCTPTQAQFVFAEVYPSLWDVPPEAGEPKDRAQVRTVARFFAERDRSGELAALFAGDPGLSPEQRYRVETEEAWTLGVTAAGQRRIPAPSAAPYARAAQAPASPRAREGGGMRPVTRPSPVNAASPRARGEGGAKRLSQVYAYLRDPDAISRRSFALIRAEVDLGRFPRALQPLALRLAHAVGDTTILNDLAWSAGSLAAGRKALAAGGSILVDSMMVAAGIRIDGDRVLCMLRDPATAALAAAEGTTLSAAAVELWRPHLAGAVVAIGNAPTALFRLLELIAAGAAKPDLVLGFPVGFVGAAEAKAALGAFGHGLNYITLKGRRGGSALAAAAVNALASPR